MSAPTRQAPVPEQPTQPLPLPDVTPRGLTSELWLAVPIVAAFAVGIPLREYVLVSEAAQSTFAIVALLDILTLSVGVMLVGGFLSRRDGRGRG